MDRGLKDIGTVELIKILSEREDCEILIVGPGKNNVPVDGPAVMIKIKN